jgi:hypothetical protein
MDYRAKSISETKIPNGQYKGYWSGHFVVVSFSSGIEIQVGVDNGVKGINCPCAVEVKDNYLYIL